MGEHRNYAIECIVAAKHVRDFDLMDWVQEEEARKAREAKALKQKENHQKAEHEKLKQQHMINLLVQCWFVMLVKCWSMMLVKSKSYRNGCLLGIFLLPNV